MNSTQEGLTHEEILKRAWTKAISDGVDAELIGIPTKVSETASAKSGGNQPPTSSLLQVCYDYYMVYYTNGVETGRDFLYRDCYTVDDNGGGGSGGGGTGDTGGGGSGGGGGTGNNCRGCGDVGVVMTALQQLTPDDFYPQNGVKPLGEFPDRCAGTQGLWNLGVANSNAETFGYLTADGKVIATATLGPMGGGSSGLVSMSSPTGGTLHFYTYPASQGLPTQAYTGMKIITYSFGT